MINPTKTVFDQFLGNQANLQVHRPYHMHCIVYLGIDNALVGIHSTYRTSISVSLTCTKVFKVKKDASHILMKNPETIDALQQLLHACPSFHLVGWAKCFVVSSGGSKYPKEWKTVAIDDHQRGSLWQRVWLVSDFQSS